MVSEEWSRNFLNLLFSLKNLNGKSSQEVLYYKSHKEISAKKYFMFFVCSQMKLSMQSMVSLLQTQQQEIEQLRMEIRVQQQATDTISSLQSHIATLETDLTSRLTGALDQHSQSESILGMQYLHTIKKILSVIV
jgi:ssRNA-specific RNase YbeY (16S rRNA maturation enzyme)